LEYPKLGNVVNTKNVSPPKFVTAKEFILDALEKTGFSVEEMADRLDYKSLKRAMSGEIPLPEAKRKHIQDLVRLARAYRPKDGLIVAEETPEFGASPRSLIRTRREEMNLTVEDLAKLSKVPAGYIRQIEAGDVQGSSEKQLRKLAAALKLDPEVLMGGSDHPPVISENRKTFGQNPGVATPGGMNVKTIPLISMAQAGELVSYEDVYDYEGVVAFDAKDPRAFAVQIRGDSMSPIYSEGTIAVCYPSHKPRNDNLVIAKLRDGAVLFKRVQFAAGEVIFHSINPNYQPMKYDERDLVWLYPVGLTQKSEL
jgi:SOS-response transcriptional repressor LexA